jgi:hypothetical protein
MGRSAEKVPHLRRRVGSRRRHVAVVVELAVERRKCQPGRYHAWRMENRI